MRTLALILILSTDLMAGLKHDFHRPVFTYAHHPDLPIAEYAKGRLGIPVPEHARIYLYAAYRYLEDMPFTSGERDAYLRVWKLRSTSVIQSPDDSGQRAWDQIRRTVRVAAESTASAPSDGRTPAGVMTRGWVTEDLCADDAFANAARTLRERIRQFGLGSAVTEFWVKGQDRVFASCDPASARLPDVAPSSLPALIRADRDYQIAAALFYSQRFEEALDRFRTIAQDGGSPWRIWAPYLMGRTRLWQARLTQDKKVYLEKLRQAEAQFRVVLADGRLSVTHAAAERLLDRCMLITHPKAGLEKLASRLMKVEGVPTRESDLLMYLNRIDDLKQVEYDDKGKPVVKPTRLPQDDFSLWWETFQSGDVNSYALALKRWHQRRTKAWLYCAISKAGEDSLEADELVTEGLKVGLEQPAGPAMRYQLARLLAVKGRFEEARRQIDTVLIALDSLPSSRNRALDLKFQLAPSMEEFLKLAPRHVIMASAEMDSDEFNSNAIDHGYWKNFLPEQRARAHLESVKAANTAARLASLDRLDATGSRVFSERLPLDALRRIALRAGSLPAHLATELRLVVWTRSVLLGRFDVAREFTPLAGHDHPSVAAELRNFIKAAEGRPAETAAARVLLKLPGARPYMNAGYGRLGPVEKHDEWGRNWWYRFTPAEMYGFDLPYVGEEGSFGRLHPTGPVLLGRLPFLTDGEQQQSVAEWGQLRKSGERGLNWIAIRIADDIRENPGRADAAETLYNVIRAAGLNGWSSPPDYDLPRPGLKAAYQLLSTRYARSIWRQRALEVEGLFLDQEK